MSQDNHSSSNYYNITAQYDIEQFTFYNIIESDITCCTSQNNNNNNDEINDSSNNSNSIIIQPVVTVHIEYATTTSGGNIVVASSSKQSNDKNDTNNINDSDNNHNINDTITTKNDNYYDITGILLWPATYLLCQYLIFEYNNFILSLLRTPRIQQHLKQQQRKEEEELPVQHLQSTSDTITISTRTVTPRTKQQQQQQRKQQQLTILELGCGCGMVGTVFMKYHTNKYLNNNNATCTKTNNNNNNNNNNNIVQQQQQQQQQEETITKISTTDDDDSKTAKNTDVLWFSTDMDTKALQLCCKNLQHNHIPYIDNTSIIHEETYIETTTTIDTNTSNTGNSKCIVQKLCWGNTYDIQQLIHTLQQQYHIGNNNNNNNNNEIKTTFDIIVAADIIYPSTCQGHIIYDLFTTIDLLLCPTNGILYISYCNRDYTYQTIRTLIDVATKMNFIISTPPNNQTTNTNSTKDQQQQSHPIYNETLRKKYLPPLLDGQILIFQRNHDDNVQHINEHIGTENCYIFPNLNQKYIQYQNRINTLKDDNNDDDEYVWDEPPIPNDDDHDHDNQTKKRYSNDDRREINKESR